MPINVTCDCGRSLKVPDALAGKKGRCPACNAIVAIPTSAPRPAKPEIADAIPVDPPPPRRRDSIRARPDRDDYDDRPSRRRFEDDEPRARRRDEAEQDRASYRRRDEEDEAPRPRPRLAREEADRPRRRREREPESSSRSWGMNPSVGGGLLAMLGAVVWFFGGLAFGIIFFYPPILFVIGLVAFIGGLVKGE